MNSKVICFDLDGVYFPDGKANFIFALEKLGVSNDEAKRVFLKSSQMNEEYKTGKISDEQFWKWAIGEWKLNMGWEEIIRIMIDGYSIDEKVASVVKVLKDRGNKTAICTNNFPARINGLDKKFGFLGNFDIHVFSYKVGECKPSLRIFNELVNSSNVLASEIIFADDNPINLSGASKVGITTFLYEGFEKYLEQLRSVGVEI